MKFMPIPDWLPSRKMHVMMSNLRDEFNRLPYRNYQYCETLDALTWMNTCITVEQMDSLNRYTALKARLQKFTYKNQWRYQYINRERVIDLIAHRRGRGKIVAKQASTVRKTINDRMKSRTLSVDDIGLMHESTIKVLLQDYTFNDLREIGLFKKIHPALTAYDDALSKFESGEWQEVPWAKKLGTFALVHFAEKDSSRVAYTQSVEKLLRNVQTVTSSGKFLKQHHPDLDDKDIKHWAEITSTNGSPWKLTILDNNAPEWEGNQDALMDEWERLYDQVNVEYSCMRGKPYVRAYGKAGNDLALAYMSKGGVLEGRCILRTDKGEFLRVFPARGVTVPLFEGMMLEAGYTRCSDGLEGIRLARIEETYDPIMPYLDGDCQSFDIYKDHILITHNGAYEASETDGSYKSKGESCDECGNMYEDGTLEYVESLDHRVCEYCLERNYTRAIVGRYVSSYQYGHVPERDTVEVVGFEDEVHIEALERLDIYQCAYTDDYYHVDNLVSTHEGFVNFDDAVALNYMDTEGNEYASPDHVKATVFDNIIHDSMSEFTVSGRYVHAKEVNHHNVAILERCMTTGVGNNLVEYITLEEITTLCNELFVTADDSKLGRYRQDALKPEGAVPIVQWLADESRDIYDLFEYINEGMLTELTEWVKGHQWSVDQAA